MLIRKIIRTDSTEQVLPSVPEAQAREQIRDEIGADSLDLVRLRSGNIMYVDDMGCAKGLPVNKKATRLYLAVCKPGTTHKIRGAVVVVGNQITTTTDKESP